jgi:hypothetical protein
MFMVDDRGALWLDPVAGLERFGGHAPLTQATDSVAKEADESSFYVDWQQELAPQRSPVGAHSPRCARD